MGVKVSPFPQLSKTIHTLMLTLTLTHVTVGISWLMLVFRITYVYIKRYNVLQVMCLKAAQSDALEQSGFIFVIIIDCI